MTSTTEVTNLSRAGDAFPPYPYSWYAVAFAIATVLACGHGPLTTLGEEKRHNPFVSSARYR